MPMPLAPALVMTSQQMGVWVASESPSIKRARHIVMPGWCNWELG